MNENMDNQEAKPFEGTRYEFEHGQTPKEAGLTKREALAFEAKAAFDQANSVDQDDSGNLSIDEIWLHLAPLLFADFKKVEKMYRVTRDNRLQSWMGKFDHVTNDTLVKDVVLSRIEGPDHVDHNGVFSLVFHRGIEPDKVWGGIYLEKIACIVVEEGIEIDHIAMNYTAKNFKVGNCYQMIYDRKTTRFKDIEFLP